MSAEDVSEIKSKTGHSRLRQERERRGWTQSEVAERIRTTRVNVGRWENRQTFPGPYYRQKLAELYGKSLQELDLIPEGVEEHDEASIPLAENNPPIAPPIWNVPYRRNPFFTGREEILAHLYTELRSSKTVALTQPQAISGLGGIGKTQIAIEYAYRYRDHYRAVFWVNASTRDTLNTDFAELVVLLGLSEQYERDQDVIVPLVKHWLATHAQWLLILDNVDNLEMVTDFLPVNYRGDVLFTTRLQALGTIAQGIEVEKMGLVDSMTFLLHRIKALPPSASLDPITAENKALAAEIFAALDGLPLALDQAGAYIEETRCGLSQYLKLFATRRRELLLRRGKFSVDHPESVAATWSLSFQKVEQECPAAVDLLNLFTFLNPESIPEEVISLGVAELGPTLEAVAHDPLQLDFMIELLLRYSLIRRNSETGSLNLHRLVQAVLKDDMDRDTQRIWAERAIRAVNQAFPDAEPETRERCQRLLPSVHTCAIHSEEYKLSFPEAARLFNEAASFLMMRGSYAQAEPLLLRTLAIRQQIMEVTHPDYARALNDLGTLYLNQGKYQEAEPLLQKALAIRQQVLGREHLEVAETLYNLANLYRARGDYAKAEPLYVQSLNVRKAASGADDPLVALSYYGLAKLYNSQEKYEQAEMFCRHALSIQEKYLGNNHSALSSTLIILAKIYQKQNALNRAREMNMRALQIRENASGVDDPRVATIANNIAELYHAERKYHEAEPWIMRAFSIHKQSLGWEHPYMAYSLNNLGENCFLRGDYDQAEVHFREALNIRERHLGFDHPHTGFSYYQLARLYSAIERHEEAEPFYRKSLSIRERSFGTDHSIVANTLEQYSLSLRKLNRTSEANELEARIQAIREKLVVGKGPQISGGDGYENQIEC